MTYAVTEDDILAAAEDMADVLAENLRALPARYQERDVLVVGAKCSACGYVAKASVTLKSRTVGFPSVISAAEARNYTQMGTHNAFDHGCGAGPGSQLLELAPVPDGAV